MQKILPLMLAALSLVGAARAQSCNPDSIQITEWGGYRNLKYHPDEEWKIIIVPPKLSHECFVALATALHKSQPGVRFEFYDATGVDLAWWADCQKAGGLAGEACERYSLKWIEKHAVGYVLEWEPCGTWSTLDRDRKVLAQFERGKCFR